MAKRHVETEASPEYIASLFHTMWNEPHYKYRSEAADELTEIGSDYIVDQIIRRWNMDMKTSDDVSLIYRIAWRVDNPRVIPLLLELLTYNGKLSGTITKGTAIALKRFAEKGLLSDTEYEMVAHAFLKQEWLDTLEIIEDICVIAGEAVLPSLLRYMSVNVESLYAKGFIDNAIQRIKK